MFEQTRIGGPDEPVYTPLSGKHEAMSLFSAPQTMKGQMNMSTEPNPLAYDGAPRPITEEEAKKIAHEEYVIRRSYGQEVCLSRGSDGGMHVRQTFTHSQAAILWTNTRRKDLRERIMAGKCQHTIFYNRAQDAFYCG